MDITPADVLEKAAEILDTEGWCQDEYTIGIAYSPEEGDTHGAHCAIGSVMCALRQLGVVEPRWIDEEDEYRKTPLFQEALDLVTSKLPTNVEIRHIPNWNDRPERTIGDVTDLLRETAKELRNAA